MGAIRITGKDEMIARFKQLTREFPDRVMDAMLTEMEIEVEEVRRRTPVDTGALKSTIDVTRPEKSGTTFTMSMTAGGTIAPYAWIVHEDLEAFHRVGQAKYMSSVLQESRGSMGRRIAARIKY